MAPPIYPIGTSSPLPTMATTTLTAHTGANGDLPGAHVFHHPGSDPCPSNANGEIKTMADHAPQRQRGMMQWKESGDLIFGMACIEERPTRCDKVSVPAPPAAPEQANGTQPRMMDCQ